MQNKINELALTVLFLLRTLKIERLVKNKIVINDLIWRRKIYIRIFSVYSISMPQLMIAVHNKC